MKLSDATIEFLKNFSAINPSLQFRHGSILRTYSQQKTLYAEVPVTEEFPQDFCIYELSKFLNSLALFKEPELEFKENFLTISSGRAKMRYVFADPSMIISPPNKTLKLPSEDVQVNVEQDTFISAVKAANILQLPELSFSGVGGVVSLKAVNSKEKTSNDYAVVVGETDKEFEVFFKVEYITKLLSRDYAVSISSKGIAQFASNDINYMVATESHSTFQ